MKTSSTLEQKLLELSNKGVLVSRKENNVYLKVSYKGVEPLISPKWNVKIYNSGSVVCNDEGVLESILQGTLKGPDESKKVIQIDDSGWGFPICGVMVGVYNGDRLLTNTVDVSYFQGNKFHTKKYLDAYADAGEKLIYKEFKAFPDIYKIEICTGYINSQLRTRLRESGFDVRVVEIKGYLQDNLEGLFKEYVRKETGQDLAYDPKGMDKDELAKSYYRVLKWGQTNAPHLLKTGWKNI